MSRTVRPVLSAPADPRLPPIRPETLSSGLHVYIVERHDLPVVDARLVVRAGAAHDEPLLAGRGSLAASLLDEGTATRTALQIAEGAELLGASLHTRASWDYTAGALHVLTPRLPQALDLLADVMLRPSFPAEELERKRIERLSSILQEQAEPRIIATHALADVVFGNAHPFGYPLGGTRATVERITRQDVATFYEARFTPANAFMVVVGDVEVQPLLGLLEDLFGGWTSPVMAPVLAPPDAAQEPSGGSAVPPPRSNGIYIVDRPGAPQSEVRVGHAGPPRRTDDYFPLYVANTILGGAFTSRLNMLLREEKAYTYGASSHFAFRAAGGPFLASTAVFTDATADAVRTIVDEVGRMAAERVTEAELERARNYITLGLPRTYETTGDIAEHVSDAALHELGVDYHDRYAESIRAVTADAVQAAAARWLRREELSIVIAGDAARIAGDLERLGLGAVHVRESD